MDNTPDRQIKSFDINKMNKQTKLPIIVVYMNPTDYPGKYVARMWDVNKPTRLVTVSDSLEEIRATLPKEMVNIGKQPNDDNCIVEVWV